MRKHGMLAISPQRDECPLLFKPEQVDHVSTNDLRKHHSDRLVKLQIELA